MAKAQFITFEGQDGAGKTSNIQTAVDFLQARGISVVCTREPGGTQLGERLRSLLLKKSDVSISENAELLLMFAARAQHIEEVIQPALQAGKWVICDRFTDATYAYQGGGRELNNEPIQILEGLVQQDLRPDLTLLLDLDTELGMLRAQQRNTLDRFESEQQKFKCRVREAYLTRQKQDPDRIKLIDASATLEIVQQRVLDTLSAHMELQA